MKKILKFWPVTFIALLAFSACQKKELENPEDLLGGRFIIKLNPPTKTVNNGIRTEWTDGDKVNVFHAEAGSRNFVNDGAFEYMPTGNFEGTLGQELTEGQAYDWYVCYPYDESAVPLQTSP